MEQDDKVYKDLQRHLDSQAVGFPATESGAEIRILKHIFSSRQALIATYLNFKPEPIETIFKRAKGLVESQDVLADILGDIEKKGGILSRIRGDKKYYCNAPLVVGMYELQLDRLTPEFIEDLNTYFSDRKFGIEFLSTELPQMRTIPIAKSISIKSNVSTFDEVTALLKKYNGFFAIFECLCRKKKI